MTAARRILLIALAIVAPLALIAAAVVLWVWAGVRSGVSVPSGTLTGFALRAPVEIVRDARGIPHIRARNEHDLFFTEGYVEGTDRLFQLDLYRRLVEGRLAEVFGSAALQSDIAARRIDAQGIAAAEERALPPRERVDLAAFAAGINAAIATRPLPPEFRMLGYRPERFRARDALVVSLATVLALSDSWYDVANRAAVVAALGPRGADAFFSISDPRYDTPTVGGPPAPVAPLPPLAVRFPTATGLSIAERSAGYSVGGSNAYAAGAALTHGGRALLANDPHLQLRIPGIWYLVDLAAPGFAVEGATLAGVPGVILGHNAHLAWGATNGTVATVRVFRETFDGPSSDRYRAGSGWLTAQKRTERFLVRFGAPVSRTYLRTRHGFVFEDDGATKLVAAWTSDLDGRSGYTAFDALDRAGTVGQALRALAHYPGPPQNFVLADDRGEAAYALAGEIWRDGTWGLGIEDGVAAPPVRLAPIPFRALPQVPPGRKVFAITANARMYGRGYPYRLSAAFEPPYRAAELARDLRARPHALAQFAAAQLDVHSLPEAELAADAVAALA
ncbi:MAG: penicillin acylase family protein, partial [Vulcanimicrobiaceae bacterium]